MAVTLLDIAQLANSEIQAAASSKRPVELCRRRLEPSRSLRLEHCRKHCRSETLQNDAQLSLTDQPQPEQRLEQGQQHRVTPCVNFICLSISLVI